MIDAHTNARRILEAAEYRESGRRGWNNPLGNFTCSAIGDGHAEWMSDDLCQYPEKIKEGVRIFFRGLLLPGMIDEAKDWLKNDDDFYNCIDEGGARAVFLVLKKLKESGL